MLQSQTPATTADVRTDPAVLRAVISVFLVAQYSYTVAFIHLPTDLRLAFAGALLVAQTALAVVALTTRPNWAGGLFLLAALTTILCWGISYGLGFGGSRVVLDPRIISKEIQLFIAPIWLLAFWDVLRIRFIASLAVGSIILGGILALTGPPNPFPGELWGTRFSTITGRIDTTPHDSAFFIMLNAFMLDQLRRTGVVSRAVAWPPIAFAIVLLIGYQVRTALVMFGVYYLVVLYYRWRHIELVRVLPLVLLGLTAVVVTAYLLFTSEDIARFGSGRVASYMLRLEVLANWDLGPLLFGTGPDTDKMRTAVWWWGEKDAHNDFLSASITVGMIGLSALIVFLVALYSKLPDLGKPLFFALITGSAFSNGLLGRPTLSIYLFLAASLSISLSARLGMAGSTRFR